MKSRTVAGWRSGFVARRTASSHTMLPLYAHTSPVYLSFKDRPVRSHAAAQFFVGADRSTDSARPRQGPVQHEREKQKTVDLFRKGQDIYRAMLEEEEDGGGPGPFRALFQVSWPHLCLIADARAPDTRGRGYEAQEFLGPVGIRECGCLGAAEGGLDAGSRRRPRRAVEDALGDRAGKNSSFWTTTSSRTMEPRVFRLLNQPVRYRDNPVIPLGTGLGAERRAVPRG